MSIPKIVLRGFLDEEFILTPHFSLYHVKDCMGRERTMPCISLTMNSGDGGESFFPLTTNFGEYIGIKNTAHIDVSHCPCPEQFLLTGLAKVTGFSKETGYCIYPLWQFDEAFLREIGGSEYEEYSAEFDRYKGIAAEEETEDISFQQSM